MLRLRDGEPLPECCLRCGERDCTRVAHVFDTRVDWGWSIPGALLAAMVGLGFGAWTYRRCWLPLCAMCTDDLLRHQRRATVAGLLAAVVMYGSTFACFLGAIAAEMPLAIILATLSPLLVGAFLLVRLRPRMLRAAGWDVTYDEADRSLVVGHAGERFVRALEKMRKAR